MIRKIILTLFIFIFIAIQNVFADLVKVNDITFDSSDSVIFVATNAVSQEVKVKKGLLSNPSRIFIDIDNAVLTKKQTSYDFKNGKLSNLKISQFSTNPNIVRIVMTYTPQLHPENVKILSIGGNLVIKLQNYKLTQDYLTPIYREAKSSAYDYFEKVRISEVVQQDAMTPIVLSPAMPKSSTGNANVQPVVPKIEPVRINPPLQESKLLSRYFVSNAVVKQGALLIAGTGVVNSEKVFYLSNPSRVVFDLPNAVCAASLRNKELRISENETVKIGQFEPTKIRLVLTTPYPKKYRLIYANDLQNMLIVRDDRMEGIKLFSNASELMTAMVQSNREYRYETHKLTFSFSEPIVQSIKRNDNSLELNLYNVNADSLANLSKKLKVGSLKNILVDRLGAIGLTVTIPITNDTTVDCLENLKATKLVLTVKSPVQIQPAKKNLTTKTVVIDAGHGGSDPGATRNNVLEKTVTLQIAELTAQMLRKQGAIVYMTRDDDTFVSLSDRVTYSNTKKPDVFVSIHINACENETAHGIETHYYKDDSLDFAKQVHKSIMQKVTETNRGVYKSRFYVIRHTEMPAILVELGFISNAEERRLMQTKERQTKFAEAITEGVINYLNNTGKK